MWINIFTGTKEAGNSAFAYLSGGATALIPTLARQAATAFDAGGSNSDVGGALRVGAGGAELFSSIYNFSPSQIVSKTAGLGSDVASAYGGPKWLSSGLETISKVADLFKDPGHTQGVIEQIDDVQKQVSLPFDLFNLWNP